MARGKNMCIIRNCRTFVVQVTAATLILVGNSQVFGGDTLQSTIAELVADIDVHLGDEVRKIKIGEFKSEKTSNIDVYSRRLATELQTQLKFNSKPVEISDSADQMILGTYRIDEKTGAIEIQSRIVKGNGSSVQALTTIGADKEFLEVAPTATTASAQNVPAEKNLSPKILTNSTETLIASQRPKAIDLGIPETIANINKQIATAALDPDIFEIRGGYLVMKDVDLGICLQEINPHVERDSPNFFGARITPRKDYPYFLLHEDKSYIIELKNFRTDIDLAVKVLFDGIDSFALSTSKEDRERWILVVPKQTSQGVYGWYKDESTKDAFRIVPDDQSLAHQMRTTANIGKIQVVVFAAWDRKLTAKIPVNFLKPRARGVGQGQSINAETKKLDTEIGRLMGQLIVDYGTEPLPGSAAANDEVSNSLLQGER